jgi:NTE family protein
LWLLRNSCCALRPQPYPLSDVTRTGLTSIPGGWRVRNGSDSTLMGMEKSSRPTAFVLSGGASLGAIQVGMLRALYERGIEPDFVVGASAGALNGAFIAARPQTVETADELADIWIGMRRGKVFPLQPLTGLFGFAGLRRHMVPDRGLRSLIDRHMTADLLEELPLPLHLIATDVFTGEEVRLSQGSLCDAILASAAIPGVLPSVDWEGRELMDGGVANNTPISHAIELGARRVYVLPTVQSCDLESPPSGALGMVVHATNLLVHRRLQDDIERYQDAAELIVLPSPCPVRVQPMDFSQAERLIDQALFESRRWLDWHERDCSTRGKKPTPAVA